MLKSAKKNSYYDDYEEESFSSSSQGSEQESEYEEDQSEPKSALESLFRQQLDSLNADALKEMLGQFKKKQTQTESHLLERYANSVVKVFIHGKPSDYDNPLMPPQPVEGSGSGFIVNFEGKNCLLTNAHCASDITLLQVRLADGHKKYTAKVKTIDHDCDLALLDVDDPEFWAQVKPLEIGDMPKQRGNLSVYGFPIGGNELCITSGQVSRIEVQPYAESGAYLLQAQTSAAINPGNSGGPAIEEGKVLGVAFQGSDAGSLLGYIIPPPVIKHFLKDALSPTPYKGFPDLAIHTQNLESKALRRHFGMNESQTGIRIKEVAPLSSARGILKKDDILLELDGLPISNEGKIDCDVGARLPFSHIINMKNIGDEIDAKILRDGREQTVRFPLLNRANTTYYSTQEYDKPPSYYINSGIVMMPLTDNFIQDATSFFSSVSIDLEKYSSTFKKKPGEEIVFIHSVLSHEKTRNIHGIEGSIIKKVNGHKVHNLREVMNAFEKNKDKHHVVETSDKDTLIFKNLSKADQREILKMYHVSHSRSSDLKQRPVVRPGCPEATALLPGFEASRQKTQAKVESLENATDVPQKKKKAHKH